MITAKVVQDSITKSAKRITTLELEYPRFIHAEFMTHRQFSRNAASSRAIPVKAMHEIISNSPAMPIHWGKNQPGMQANEELDLEAKNAARVYWLQAMNDALRWSKELNDLNAHKQIVNRITEPFQNIKVVVTATEFKNFFELRRHKDAQPEIQELANKMYAAMSDSSPMVLYGSSEWHVPYVGRERTFLNRSLSYWDSNGQKLTAEEAIKVSASCCAQVSYRKSDDSLEKALAIYARLIESEPMHASPIEHQACPASTDIIAARDLEKGATHFNRDGTVCSANFVGWIQFRQMLGQ